MMKLSAYFITLICEPFNRLSSKEVLSPFYLPSKAVLHKNHTNKEELRHSLSEIF